MASTNARCVTSGDADEQAAAARPLPVHRLDRVAAEALGTGLLLAIVLVVLRAPASRSLHWSRAGSRLPAGSRRRRRSPNPPPCSAA
jgi:hypothetical protein